ncbi:type VII secretion target [Kitasatospora indigofera]|uniref:type VII secretion target n=1 Tax=Kitasatospora indigofera TaxID=67307 RepID=UPI0033AABBA0
MGDQIKINPDDLRISGNRSRAIAGDLAGPAEAAIAASRSASGQMAGWSVASKLEQVANGWAPALAAVRDRLTKAADNLESTAQGHAWNDRAIAEAWEKQGAAR